MNDVEVLKRAYAPVTKIYSDLNLPPASGLEGVGVSIINYSDITMIIRFLHQNRDDTTIRIPPLLAYDNPIPLFYGVVIDNALQFELHIKEINRGR